MMAVWATSGALFLVMLTGASYSYPAKQGFDRSSSYSSSYSANPASTGSTLAVPASGFAPIASGSRAASKAVSYPALAAPRRVASSPHPGVRREPAAISYSSSSSSAPVRPGHASSSSAGSVHPSSFQPTSTQEIPWAVAPPYPFSGAETTRPSARQFTLSKPAPAPLGPSNVSPPGPFPPEFQAGELSQYGRLYEHGNYESETKEQGFQQPPPSDVHFSNGQDSTSKPQSSGPGRSWAGYPFPYRYDYMFLTGQYPPGTVTHSSSSFEQGTDHWQDTHYIKNYFPASPSTQQVETFPTNFEAPPSVMPPIQPVKQNVGRNGYGVATGQSQPYGAVGLQRYFQPGAFEQPRQHSPAGGYSLSKVGY